MDVKKSQKRSRKMKKAKIEKVITKRSRGESDQREGWRGTWNNIVKNDSDEETEKEICRDQVGRRGG
jgi:hypothetical protein